MTNRHINVVEEYLINGLNQMEAYQKIYPKSSKKSAYVQACILFKKPEVIKMIEDNQAILRDKVIITKEEIVQVLVDIVNDSKDDPKTSSIAIKAVAELNKMLGNNATEKKEITHHGQIIWNEEKTYKK